MVVSGVTPPSAGSSPYAPRRTLKVDTFRFQRKLRTLENISPLSYLYVKRCWESLQSVRTIACVDSCMSEWVSSHGGGQGAGHIFWG